MSAEKRRVPYGEGRTRVEVKCPCCGQWFLCAGFTNACTSCESETLFNMSGQMLAPRRTWNGFDGE